MEQLILIGIILVFSSVMEAVARKNKQRDGGGGGAPGPSNDLPEVRPPRPAGARVPSYDEDPSFDDMASAGSQGGHGGGSAPREGPAVQRGPAASEGLIPADVWEEIQALARGGKTPARTAPPSPRPAPPAPARVPTRASSPAPPREGRPEPAPMSRAARPTRASPEATGEAEDAGEHAVHLTHPKYGTPVKDRLTEFDRGTRKRGLSADSEAVRSVLRGGGARLRQAVLLQEILGPPVSLKDDPSAG